MEKLVLIVDDDEKVRKMLTFLFTAKGFEVVNACNGVEAMEHLKDIRPSVVILDMMMPELDGATFYNEMKADHKLRDIPVIVLTALPASDSMRKFVSIAEEDYIEKPFKSAHVLGRVLELMSQSC